MSHYPNLLAESPNAAWSVENLTPLPVTGGFYRSRIYTSDISLNPLIAACDQLLSLVTTLTTTDYPENSEKFFQDLAHEIRAFEHRAQVVDYPANIIVAARYALCCLLDETIANTPWGQNNHWSEKNLLGLFHNENYGGIRFFSIIDRALENISSNLHLIELLYLCLNLGFIGKYQELTDKQHELTNITNRLYQIVGQYSFRNHKNILIQEESPTPLINELNPPQAPTTIGSPRPYWIAIGAAIIISSMIYLGINLKLNQLSKPVYAAIEEITQNKDSN